MVALAAPLCLLHVSKERIHLQSSQGAMCSDRAMAGEASKESVEGLFHAPRLPIFLQICQDIADQLLCMPLR